MLHPFSRAPSTAVRTVLLLLVSTVIAGTATAQFEEGAAGDWTWLLPTDRIEAPEQQGPSGDYGRENTDLPPIVVDERRDPDERRRPRTEGRTRDRDRDDRNRRGRDRDDRKDRDRDHRDHSEGDEDVERRGDREYRGRTGPPAARRGEDGRGTKGGPPFCRSGAGHPVFGMEWCRKKGFAPERDRRTYDREQRRNPEWQYERRRNLEDILFNRTETDRSGRLTERQLEDLLGRPVVRYFDDLGRQLELRGGVHGRLQSTDRGQVLRVQIGPQSLAALADTDWDGRVDRAVVAQPR